MDREKVIKETEDGIAFAESRGFGGLANTMRDALAMLQEQEAEIAFLKAMQLQTIHNMSNEDIGNAVKNVLRL